MSPDDESFDAIWSEETPGGRLSFKAGDSYVSATEPIVWVPFLVLLVTGWVALAALLPPEVAAQFIELTLGSLAQTVTNVSISVLGLLIANLVVLGIAFYLYTWVFRWVVGRLLEYTDERRTGLER